MSGPTEPLQVADLLQRTPLFALVPRASLELLAAAARLVEVPGGTTVIRQGDFGSEAFLLVDGVVDIMVEFEGLGQVRISEARPFDVIGETGALCHHPRTTSVVARGPVTLLSVHRMALEKLTSENPDVALAIIGTMAERLHRTGRHLACLISAANALRSGAATIDAVTSALRAENDFAPYAQAIEVVAGQIADNESLRREMEAAARIQHAILPQVMNWNGHPPFAEIAASMRPARHVGGDFYDFFTLDPNRIALVVGDVSGKGVPAALFMALARNSFRAIGRYEFSAARVLEAVNRTLCEGNDDLFFLTVVYAVLDRRNGVLTYAIGGHDPPLLRHADGRVDALASAGDIALGVDATVGYGERKLTLSPDDRLLIYTDGVSEAQRACGTLFGREPLLELVGQGGGASVQAMIAAVNDAVDGFTGSAPQSDDITCLALRLTEVAAPVVGGGQRRIEITLGTDLSELQRVAANLYRFGAELGLPAGPVEDLALALDELVGNTLTHGFAPGSPGTVTVTIAFDEGWLTVTIQDTATPFDPLQAPPADVDLALDEREIGGLGIHLARALTDDISYRYLPGQNLLTVRKRVEADASPGPV